MLIAASRTYIARIRRFTSTAAIVSPAAAKSFQIVVYIEYNYSICGEPPFYVLDILGAKRVDQTVAVRFVFSLLIGGDVTFERTAVDRHVTVAQAEAAVNQGDEQFARRLSLRQRKSRREPCIEGERQTRAPRRPHGTRTLGTGHSGDVNAYGRGHRRRALRARARRARGRRARGRVRDRRDREGADVRCHLRAYEDAYAYVRLAWAWNSTIFTASHPDLGAPKPATSMPATIKGRADGGQF